MSEKFPRRKLDPGPTGRRAWLGVLIFCLGLLQACDAAQAEMKMIKIFTKRDGPTIQFLVENLEATELTVTFELEMQNLKCSEKLPYTFTLAPLDTTEAFHLSSIRPGKGWNYKYTSSYTMGSCVAVHDDSYLYRLPFAPSNAFRVTQGYNGEFSHTGADQYSIDFKMAVGTPVHAAREGVVVKIKQDSCCGGPDRKYENDANYILIRHADGTLANYAHLAEGGSVVKVGQFVRAGDFIGYSGNTGYSSGPHLHFSVFKTSSGAHRQTLPVLFRTADDTAVTLVQGRTYKSVPEASFRMATPTSGPTWFTSMHGAGSPGPKSGAE